MQGFIFGTLPGMGWSLMNPLTGHGEAGELTSCPGEFWQPHLEVGCAVSERCFVVFGFPGVP